MNTSDIKSANWALSVTTLGSVVEGVEDISQCINIILSTRRGSDPFRPLFGSKIFDYIDSPIGVAVANVKREIFDAVALWEPRVGIKSITHEYTSDGAVYFGAKFLISWQFVDGGDIYMTEYALRKQFLEAPTLVEVGPEILTEEGLILTAESGYWLVA